VTQNYTVNKHNCTNCCSVESGHGYTKSRTIIAKLLHNTTELYTEHTLKRQRLNVK